MNERQFVVKIEGPEINDNQIPLLLLADILKGIQQTVYYIALSEKHYDIKKKVRVPNDIQKACELRRVLEKPGSYAVVVQVAEPPQMAVFEPDIGLNSCKKFLDIINTLSNQASASLTELVPDSLHRRRILRSIESFCPKFGDEWQLSLSGFGMPPTGCLNAKVRQDIGKLLVEKQIEHRVITGELVRLHLDENRLAIEYKPTQRVLDCYYDPELEDFVIQNLRDLIQVYGKVQLDSNGQPDKIVEVFEIAELDLRPLRLTLVTSDDTVLVLNSPLEIEAIFDEELQEVVFELPEFNIIAADVKREEAIQQLQSDLVWLWKEYVDVPEQTLSEDAKNLRERLRALVKEVRRS